MTMLPHILLAQHNEPNPMRFIGILVIIAIVVLGNLFQWLQKYQEQKRKLEQQRREARAQMPTPPQPASARARARAPQPNRPSPRPHPTAPASAHQPPPAPARRPVQRKPQAPPRLPPVPQAQTTVPRRAEVSTTEIGASAAAAKQAANTRTEFLRAVLNPRSLRNAYVLSEILQPPLALRDQASSQR